MGNIKLFVASLSLLLLFVTGTTAGCTPGGIEETTIDELFSEPGRYHNREVIIEGFYFHGFETIVLSDKLEYSGYAEGHLIPEGRMIWVSGGIPKEVYDKLNQQQTMGPLERYGKVRVTGKFEYDGQYGHLGAFDKQITPVETQILPWTPTESETLQGEGFAIYLLARDIPVSRMPMMSHVELEENPFLSLEDIISYSQNTHEIKLTESAMNKLRDLDVPVNGKPFMVCVNRQEIYWGAFWTPISSLSFDGITILKPFSPEQDSIQLEPGYPSASFLKGEDPRADARILQSLEKAGKLK